MHRSAIITFAFVVFAPSIARADDDEEQMVIVEQPAADPPPEAPPVMVVTPASKSKRMVEVSYASSTLMLDGAAVAMFTFGLATETKPLPGLGILTYGLGPPIVHFSHGNVGKGFADLAIRVISPFLFAVPGLMVAMAVEPNRGSEARKDAMDIGGFTGMAVGAAFAMAVDAFVLAKERVPEERAPMDVASLAGTRRTEGGMHVRRE